MLNANCIFAKFVHSPLEFNLQLVTSREFVSLVIGKQVGGSKNINLEVVFTTTKN